MNTKLPQRVAGFTLLDALIAVVVLATGILALTFLQVTMLRTAAESRERSVAMTLAQNIVEERRANGNQTFPNYQALDSQGTFTSGACDYDNAGALVPPNSSGLPSDYRYCVQVQRFRASGNTFAAVPTSGVGAPAYGGLIPEFKQITVDIGWRKTDGSWGNLRLGDALSGIPLINSNDLENRPISTSVVQPPPSKLTDEDVLTQNTNFTTIPLDDGTGARIAATNPTPKVIGGGVAETSFQVYKYEDVGGGLINVQREIDTRVIGCKCTSRSAPDLLAPDQSTTTELFLTRPLRTTYWDGARYTEPGQATYPTTDLIGAEQTSAVGLQSPLCDVCCRDHHDPSSVDYAGPTSAESDDIPKFDPYRADHIHYVDPTGDLTANRVTAANQNYEEVCRVIRVNGMYRVSQDPLLDHYAYIPTDNNAIDYTTISATAGYQNFVKTYVNDRVLPLSGYDWAVNRVTVSALESSNGLNDQAGSPIQINLDDRRYLQNRAILMDVLGFEAKSVMQSCIDETGTGTPTDQACALRHTPFASINLTELTRWSVERDTAAARDPITVQPKNFSVSTPTGAPVAGQVFDASGAIANSIADAVGAINRSVATLVDKLPVVYQAVTDTLWPASDRQGFQFIGGTRPSVKITISLTGLSYFTNHTGDSFAPYIGWVNAAQATQGDCIRVVNTTSFVCDLYTAANASNVQIRMFNYHQQLTAQNNGAVCGSGPSRVRADLPRCNLFRPNAFTGSTTVTFTPPAFRTSSDAGKPRDDEASADLGAVVDGGSYSVTFEESTSNPFNATFTCDALTGQPVLSFQDQECRR
ncbi:hypothetical protein [Lysobacter sp. CFH 32150]|uniref:type IV pilus modification PilV family protein n=1 Tax=Lysobacter sp. CFH 32150 TaxID=2927128 RepID=UPI001FA72966|nr:hypothetical protein [Lysobacter sp. CFH 32150]MCI4566959.1 hypothetical protein [Lysobacter sp. CFH 32150]